MATLLPSSDVGNPGSAHPVTIPASGWEWEEPRVTHGYSAHQSLDFGHRPYYPQWKFSLFLCPRTGFGEEQVSIAPNSELRKGGKQVGE